MPQEEHLNLLSASPTFFLSVGRRMVRGDTRLTKRTTHELSWSPHQGGECAISNLSVDTACETLGVYTAPDGNAAKAIEAMKEKAGTWVERARDANLHKRQVWFMLDKKF